MDAESMAERVAEIAERHRAWHEHTNPSCDTCTLIAAITLFSHERLLASVSVSGPPPKEAGAE